MANETKSNGTSPSHLENISEKASAPSPSSTPSKESDPPEEAPSKSPPPPIAPPPHSPPPPSPFPSPPPPPPPQAQVPPPHSSPPPSKVSPSPPPPPPSSPPPTPPSSPSWSPPSTPASDDNSPPPSQSNSPPSPPSSKIHSLSSPSSHISPPQSQNRPSLPQSPSPSSHSKPSSSPSKSSSLSKSSSSQDNTGQYIGLAFAAIFVLAFMAIIFALVIRRKDKRGNFYGMPPPNKPQMNGDVHYYVESPGFAYSHRNNGGLIQHLRTPSDPTPQMSAGHILFSYDQVLEITNGFSSENVIGEGGFGRVYKALMPDGRVGAVKLLKAGSGQGEREFRAEVDTISRVHHRHLVSLIGYCLSEQQRVLIYEFVPNGNLDQHLHESEWNVLDWPKRMKIAIGAARGLAYLHEGCNPKIIHRDIKSANILLDNAYEAQVADFGLARLTDDAYTHVSTRVMGTFGYMAPEYATSGKLTDRSDVFSFGVVLLELVTGRKPVDPTQPVGDESLVEWARPLLLRAIETGDFSELVDPRLQRQYVESEMVRMIEAAVACVRHSAPKRPRMVQDLDPLQLQLQYGVAFRETTLGIARALDSGDQLYDLSNGVKYGQSTVYDSGQYNEDIMRFKRMANGSFVDSEFDMYSTEYSSGDMSRSIMMPQSSSDHLDIKAMQN